MFDLVVGASSIYAGSWLEGAGRGLRREPGAALDRRPRRDAGRRRRRVRPRRHHRQPLGAGRGPAHGPRARPPAGRARPTGSPRRPARTRRSRRRCDVMDAELVGVPVDDRWRLTGPALREVLEAHGPRDVLRRRRHLRHHQLRHHRRPRLGGRGLPRVRALVPRRRRLRRRRPGRAVGARPLRRHRAVRLVHRRPAQVAVRAVRLLRPALPRAGARRGPRTPSRPATSTCSPRPTSGTPPTTRSA